MMTPLDSRLPSPQPVYLCRRMRTVASIALITNGLHERRGLAVQCPRLGHHGSVVRSDGLADFRPGAFPKVDVRGGRLDHLVVGSPQTPERSEQKQVLHPRGSYLLVDELHEIRVAQAASPLLDHRYVVEIERLRLHMTERRHFGR